MGTFGTAAPGSGCDFLRRGLLNLLFPLFLPAFRPSQLTHSPTVLRHTTQTPAAQLIFGKKVAKNILPHRPVPSMGQQLIAFEEKKKKIKP